MGETKSVGRPLSPHLQIYRWPWPMAMSIAHRVTGCALYFGTILAAGWLLAVASGPEAYAWAQWFFASPIGLVILFGYTWALLHHAIGGIRHLVWDTGAALDLASRELWAKGTLAGSLVLTVVVWIVVLAVW